MSLNFYIHICLLSHLSHARSCVNCLRYDTLLPLHMFYPLDNFRLGRLASTIIGVPFSWKCSFFDTSPLVTSTLMRILLSVQSDLRIRLSLEIRITRSARGNTSTLSSIIARERIPRSIMLVLRLSNNVSTLSEVGCCDPSSLHT